MSISMRLGGLLAAMFVGCLAHMQLIWDTCERADKFLHDTNMYLYLSKEYSEDRITYS